MGERWYVVKVIITSSGAEDRNLTPYDNYDVADEPAYYDDGDTCGYE